MPAERTTDVHIDLNLLFTPGTLIGAGHGGSSLLDRSFNCAKCNLQVRGNRDVRSTGVLKFAFSTLPDSRTFPPYGYIVAPWTGMSRLRDDFNLAYALPDEPTISWPKAAG